MTWSYHHLHLRARISSTTRQGRLPWRNKLARRVRHLRPSDFNNKAAGTSGSREALSLSLSSSQVQRLNREFNSRRMINYACVSASSRILRNIYRLTTFPLPFYTDVVDRMIAPRFIDLIFRGAHTPLSRKGNDNTMRIMVLLIALHICFFLFQ